MNKFTKYLKGDLSESELEQFSEILITAKLDRDKRKDWEQKLKSDYGVEKKEAKVAFFRRKSIWTLLSVAASLVLLLSVFLLMPSSKEPAYLAAVNEHIAKRDIMADQTLLRKGQQEAKEIRVIANLAYSKADYEKGIIFWERLLISGEADAKDYFYLGLCYLQNAPSNPQSSIKNLLKARALDKASELDAEISWKLALAYLKAGKKKEGTRELLSLLEKGSYKVQEVKDLLELLKK